VPNNSGCRTIYSTWMVPRLFGFSVLACSDKTLQSRQIAAFRSVHLVDELEHHEQRVFGLLIVTSTLQLLEADQGVLLEQFDPLRLPLIGDDTDDVPSGDGECVDEPNVVGLLEVLQLHGLADMVELSAIRGSEHHPLLFCVENLVVLQLVEDAF
jgi:hypothetical protein